ncbi:Uncharacterised protein [Sphingomonas paucimobilis]|nr:Uncharacterised protein [Sphingomonas paucimobilis]
MPFLPIGVAIPNSARCARIAFDNCVRWRFRIRRTRCSIIAPCCSGDLMLTKRIVGRVTASQIASASAASFLPRLTYGFTYCAGISFTSCPSKTSSRAQ